MIASVSQRLATELAVDITQIEATIAMLDDGATVPFIARYRKEVTGGLDDVQLRTLEERLTYIRDLDARRLVILESIEEQGKLTEELRAQIWQAEIKARLEDLYLPYVKKLRTKGQAAIEAGLEPLATHLLAHPEDDPTTVIAQRRGEFPSIETADAALEGARAILTERFAEDADLNGELREDFWTHGRLKANVKEGQESAGAKFSDYFAYVSSLNKLPAHRILAMMRGEKDGHLSLSLDPLAEDEPEEAPRKATPYEGKIARKFGIADKGRPGDRWLLDTVRWAWRTRFSIHIDIELRSRLWQQAEDESVQVFGHNLRDMLLAAPAGTRPTLGLDPGFRTGVKVAVVDGTGKVVDTAVVYPHEPQRQWRDAILRLGSLCRIHKVELLAIGNGTASRETEKLALDVIKANPELKLTKAVVSEAGASVYSASAYASSELPELDVSLRGAVSIARRLQDPLAELVKIEPKSIGAGQYQHDVSPLKLTRSLDAVVEDAVNAVGVDVNTASAPLLARVSGIGESLAAGIVAYREANGAFRAREELRRVPRLGEKTFELCAGFLRISGGDNPLDRSGVHPESYPLVEKILASVGSDLTKVMGNAATLRSLKPQAFVTEQFGLPTVTDIIKELEKPGRDPRPSFKTATFAEGIEKVSDLKPGMMLEGTVTNCSAFGAFVDIGVHQDGLIHVSQLSNKFVKDPREVVKIGDVVKVRVVDVDLTRNRISLTMRLAEPIEKPDGGPKANLSRGNGRPTAVNQKPSNNAFADAMRRAKEGERRR